MRHYRLCPVHCVPASYFFSYARVSCQSQPAGPRSLDAMLHQLPKTITDLTPEQLCELIKDESNGSGATVLHNLELAEADLPQSYYGLTNLSQVVTHLLRNTSDSDELLTQVRKLAALRLGLSVDSLATALSPSKQIELWDYRNQTQPTLIARLPACEHADFGSFEKMPSAFPQQPLPARPIPNHLTYLNLGEPGQTLSFRDAADALA